LDSSDAAYQGTLQFAFGVLFGEFEKVEGVLVLDSQLCLRAQLRRQSLIEVGLPQQGLLVALVLNLVDKNTLGPAKFLSMPAPDIHSTWLWLLP